MIVPETKVVGVPWSSVSSVRRTACIIDASAPPPHIVDDRVAPHTCELEQLLDVVLEVIITEWLESVVERGLADLLVLAANLLLQPTIATGEGRAGEKRIEIQIAQFLHRHRAIQDRK